MNGKNSEQFAVVSELKIVVGNIIADWNSIHREQVKKQKTLSKLRFSKALAKYLSQPHVYNELVNMTIENLEER